MAETMLNVQSTTGPLRRYIIGRSRILEPAARKHYLETVQKKLVDDLLKGTSITAEVRASLELAWSGMSATPLAETSGESFTRQEGDSFEEKDLVIFELLEHPEVQKHIRDAPLTQRYQRLYDVATACYLCLHGAVPPGDGTPGEPHENSREDALEEYDRLQHRLCIESVIALDEEPDRELRERVESACLWYTAKSERCDLSDLKQWQSDFNKKSTISEHFSFWAYLLNIAIEPIEKQNDCPDPLEPPDPDSFIQTVNFYLFAKVGSGLAWNPNDVVDHESGRIVKIFVKGSPKLFGILDVPHNSKEAKIHPRWYKVYSAEEMNEGWQFTLRDSNEQMLGTFWVSKDGENHVWKPAFSSEWE